MNKYKQIKTNIPIKDFEILQEKAHLVGIKLSAYLKKLLLDSDLLNNITPKEKRKIEQTKAKKIIFKPVDPKLLYELNKIGVNLNQITKTLNINYEIDFIVLEELEKIENHLQQIKKAYL